MSCWPRQYLGCFQLLLIYEVPRNGQAGWGVQLPRALGELGRGRPGGPDLGLCWPRGRRSSGLDEQELSSMAAGPWALASHFKSGNMHFRRKVPRPVPWGAGFCLSNGTDGHSGQPGPRLGSVSSSAPSQKRAREQGACACLFGSFTALLSMGFCEVENRVRRGTLSRSLSGAN